MQTYPQTAPAGLGVTCSAEVLVTGALIALVGRLDVRARRWA